VTTRPVAAWTVGRVADYADGRADAPVAVSDPGRRSRLR